MHLRNDGSGMTGVALILFVLFFSTGCEGTPEVKPPPEVKDHRVDVKIDKRITIVPTGTGLNRAMISMVRHPDGTIYLNTQTQEKLYKSNDNGQTWTPLPVKFPGELAKQAIHGLFASSDGRLWLIHQTLGKGRTTDEFHGDDLFVSYSSDKGKTWTMTAIDYANLAPGAPQQPYAFSYNDYNTFFERPDGTMMLGVGLRYDDGGNYWDKYQLADQSRIGFNETLIRSTDGGKTWGDPTLVHQHVAETCYTVDPNNPDHILAMTRKQRMLLPGETKESLEKDLGEPPPNLSWPFKGAILLESTDAGRSFREVPGSYLGYYSHRGTMLWTKDNLIVAPHMARGRSNWGLVVDLSLDGGKTWVDGTQAGAATMNKAKNFMLVSYPPGFSFTTATVEISPNHFLTVYATGTPLTVKGVFWHIKFPKAQAQGGALNIGRDKQLFIDDYIIESLDGLSKKLNQPTKYAGNPVLPVVLKGQRSWDADMPIYFSSVLFDEEEKLFKMWYGLWENGKGDHDSVLAYATSKDGITWQKPSLGIFEYRGTKENNIVMSHSGLASGVFKDLHEKDPAKRYKMVHPWRSYKVYASYSADGLHWNLYNEGKEVIFVSPGHDSHMVAYWDEGLEKYVAIVRERTGRIKNIRRELIEDEVEGKIWKKLWRPTQKTVPENHTLRRVGQAESDDFVHWTPVRVIVAADSADPVNRDQFYNMEVMQYEGLRIGFMTVFSYDRDRNRGAVQLTYSRDGMNWHRGGNREVFLPLSDQPGDFDWGMIYPLQAPVVVGDEIYIYYDGHASDHNQVLPDDISEVKDGIGLAKLRLDGFVSVDAGAAEGTLITKPFIFSGQKLLINADAKQGRVLVEILDKTGKPVSGFSKQDSDPCEADKIRHTVTWQGKADLRPLKGKVIKLKFHLENAKLFSFGFDD